MGAIFISYRREDAEGQAGRLFDDLSSHFGKQCVFMDVAGIEPGRDFRRVIDAQVASCSVLLAVIGKGWLTAKDDSGRLRLEDPTDFVRLETASALKRDIPVIPVLVRGATMPHAEQLPADLADLAYRNGVELTHARWDSDIEVLINALRPYVEPPQKDIGGDISRAKTGGHEENERPKPGLPPDKPVPDNPEPVSPVWWKHISSRVVVAAMMVVVVVVIIGFFREHKNSGNSDSTRGTSVGNPSNFTVYVQYAAGNEAVAANTQKALKDLGYRVPGVEKVDNVPSRLQVRYYTIDQKDDAERLAAQLEKVLGLQAGMIDTTPITSTRRPPNNVLEVWLPR